MLKNPIPKLPLCHWGIPDDYYSHIRFCRKVTCKYYGGECRDDCKEREPEKNENVDDRPEDNV